MLKNTITYCLMATAMLANSFLSAESSTSIERISNELAQNSILAEWAQDGAEDELEYMNSALCYAIDEEMEWKDSHRIHQALIASYAELGLPIQRERIARGFRATFTANELRSLHDFYNTEMGREIAAKHGALSREFKFQISSLAEEFEFDIEGLVTDALQLMEADARPAKQDKWSWWGSSDDVADEAIPADTYAEGPLPLHTIAQTLLSDEVFKEGAVQEAMFFFEIASMIMEDMDFPEEFWEIMPHYLMMAYEQGDYGPDLSALPGVVSKTYREVLSEEELKAMYDFFVVGEGEPLVEKYGMLWAALSRDLGDGVLNRQQLTAFVNDCNRRLAADPQLGFKVNLWDYLFFNDEGLLEDHKLGWEYYL